MNDAKTIEKLQQQLKEKDAWIYALTKKCEEQNEAINKYFDLLEQIENYIKQIKELIGEEK